MARRIDQVSGLASPLTGREVIPVSVPPPGGGSGSNTDGSIRTQQVAALSGRLEQPALQALANDLAALRQETESALAGAHAELTTTAEIGGGEHTARRQAGAGALVGGSNVSGLNFTLHRGSRTVPQAIKDALTTTAALDGLYGSRGRYMRLNIPVSLSDGFLADEDLIIHNTTGSPHGLVFVDKIPATDSFQAADISLEDLGGTLPPDLNTLNAAADSDQYFALLTAAAAAEITEALTAAGETAYLGLTGSGVGDGAVFYEVTALSADTLTVNTSAPLDENLDALDPAPTAAFTPTGWRVIIMRTESSTTQAADGGYTTLRSVRRQVARTTFTQQSSGAPGNADNDPREISFSPALTTNNANAMLNVAVQFHGDGVGGGSFYIGRVQGNATHDAASADFASIPIDADETRALRLGTDQAQDNGDGTFTWRLIIGSHVSGVVTTPTITIDGVIEVETQTTVHPNAWRDRFRPPGDRWLIPYLNETPGVLIPMTFPVDLRQDSWLFIGLEPNDPGPYGALRPYLWPLLPNPLLRRIYKQAADLGSNGRIPEDLTRALYFRRAQTTNYFWQIGGGTSLAAQGGWSALMFVAADASQPLVITHFSIVRSDYLSPFSRGAIVGIWAL